MNRPQHINSRINPLGGKTIVLQWDCVSLNEFHHSVLPDGSLIDSPALVELFEKDDLTVSSTVFFHGLLIRRDTTSVFLVIFHSLKKSIGLSSTQVEKGRVHAIMYDGT